MLVIIKYGCCGNHFGEVANDGVNYSVNQRAEAVNDGVHLMVLMGMMTIMVQQRYWQSQVSRAGN